MNVKLLRRVAKHILEEPRRLNMSVGLEPSNAAPCGTTGCIAGWTALLSRKFTHADVETCGVELRWTDVKNAAISKLGLTPDEASVLFHIDNWPAQFREPFNNAYDAYSSTNHEAIKRTQAEITAKRIEYFITNLA
jgi:hypothetical protein